ncbi:MAG: beta-N-acetylhexosaminidase [Xanthomonadales bacterium]|nr:beta-N-acetylhexosaminidase [Xanthomonadales bacterium]
MLIGLRGLELEAADMAVLQHPATGGVVLFTRNYAGRDQLKALTAAIREVGGRELLITVDHEGGRVQRFRDSFTRLPPLATLGRIYSDHPDRALDLAYRHARVMATELLLCGVDLSFAPVLDLGGKSEVIGDRAFSESAAVVQALGAHYLAGMHDAGMKTCGKHFPGHGSVAADSHVSDVTDGRALKDIEAQDLAPFRALGEHLDSVMMAHVVYPDAAPEPAGYSRFWIRDYLRARLGFRGLVFSDDLGMHAAGYAGKLPERLDRSLEAGCDAVLVCEPDDVIDLYRALDDTGMAQADSPLAALRGGNTPSEAELAMVGEWAHWQRSMEELVDSRWA